MKFTNDFSQFLANTVNLNQSRIDRLQDHVNAIEGYLASDTIIGEQFIDLIPAGSWAHRSIIRPVKTNDEFDADVLLYMEENPNWLPKDYLNELHAAFKRSPIYKDKVQWHTRCIRINYAGDFHVDVVPYVERNDGHYVTNRLEPPEEGRFEASNPELFTSWVDDRERYTNGNFIKTVRLAKYLRDHKDTFSCKSVILKTLLGGVVNEIEATNYPELYLDLPTTLKTLFSKLTASLPNEMPAVMDPGETGDNFTDRYKDAWDYDNFKNMITHYSAKIDEAYNESDAEKSARLWRNIFGDDFKPENSLSKSSGAHIVTRAPKEEFINEHPYSFDMELDPVYKLKVVGRCIGTILATQTRKKGFRQFDLPTRGNRVPKDRWILFTAKVKIVGAYSMYWKVRNEGEEARIKEQLRGEIRPDGGSGQLKESTQYKGYHYVECYVVQGRKVVAYDKQRVTVI